MMRCIAVNLLVAILSLPTNATNATNIELVDANDSMNKLVDHLLVNLFSSAIKAAPIQDADVDNVMLAHAGHLTSPSMARPALWQVGRPPAMQNRDGVKTQAQAKGQQYIVRQPKPIGITLESRGRGQIYVKDVTRDADPRVAKGDKLLAVSASFGAEIWPAAEIGRVNSAINTRIGPIYMKLESSGNKPGATGVAGLFGAFTSDKGGELTTLDDDEDFRDNSNQDVDVLSIAIPVVGLTAVAVLAYVASN